jgi:hypothetical protein
MAIDINTFYNIAQQKQFSRDIFMRVKQIALPGLSLNGESDLVYARTATRPGRDIQNKNVRFGGQNFNLNGTADYPGSESYSIEFYCDQDLDLRKKLERASRTAFNNETTSGSMCLSGPENYIILDVLKINCGVGNASGGGLQVAQTVKLVGASIRNVGELSYSIAEGTGDVVNFTSTFSYHFYEDFS